MGTMNVPTRSKEREVAAISSQNATTTTGLLPVVEGIVVHGDHRGRTIGFPTANIDCVSTSVADGVYAGWYEGADGLRHPAAVSIGVRPTFKDPIPLRLVEAHLIDFSGDLYGETARVSLVSQLREQRRFDGVDELVRQLTADVDACRRLLGRAG